MSGIQGIKYQQCIENTGQNIQVLIMLPSLAIYGMMELLFERLFIREEQMQTEKLAQYTTAVSKSLNLTEIYRALVDVITETLKVKKVYICIEENDGSYRAVYSTSPLDDKRFLMSGDHPLVRWMCTHNECLFLKDFKRTMEYKSM